MVLEMELLLVCASLGLDLVECVSFSDFLFALAAKVA
jgi:hypothetical protein